MIHTLCSTEYKKIAKTIEITYGSYESPFGISNIAIVTKPLEYSGSICFLAFTETRSFLSSLNKTMPHAKIFKDNVVVNDYGIKIFSKEKVNLPIFLKGTEMQLKVWENLIESKANTRICYEDIAQAIGKDKAIRAVANAIGRNPVAFLIPCHRILRKSGTIGGYRWGISLKKKLLSYEAANR